ncbi:hypothetical protein MPER_10011 [Moniliophthora perniciosa FA553]|nr:hypothetical protein MPER_10011 [Moniliophthora perniciosa FA553]
MDGLPDSPRQDLVRVYNAFQVVGFISNFVIVFIATLSRRVRRTLVWYLFMHGWILWCISHFLIIEYQTERRPPFGLCLVQAGFIYAGPPCMALLTLGVLAQLYSAMYASIRQQRPPSWINPLVIASPLAIFVLVFLEVIAVQTRSGEMKAAMYCNISDPMVVLISTVLDGLTCLAMLILEVLVFLMMYRHWSTYKRISTFPGSVMSGTMAYRISFFSFLPMVALGFSLQATISNVSSSESHIVIASLPIAAALIFGTQKDIVYSCMFWRKDRPLSKDHTLLALIRREQSVSEV